MASDSATRLSPEQWLELNDSAQCSDCRSDDGSEGIRSDHVFEYSSPVKGWNRAIHCGPLATDLADWAYFRMFRAPAGPALDAVDTKLAHVYDRRFSV